jgi:lactate dehydrogenase-like 2-hydroxyacid dehydrogenase
VKITILDNLNLLPEAVEQLEKLAGKKLSVPKETETTEQQLIERTGNAEIILISPFAKITQSYLSACPSVKYICLCGTATGNIDLEAVKERNITLTNIKDYGDEPAAEYMFMLLLMLARGEGKYQWKEMPTELMGKSLGVIGLGALGKAVANLALGFKMHVYYYSLHRKTDFEEKEIKYLDLDQLLKTCDVIAVTTPTNVKVLSKEEFKLTKSNSVLMYLSSGEALEKEAFLDWISRNNNFALFNLSAGENYYQLFNKLPNVIYPKVIAGYIRETKERLGEKVLGNLKHYLELP